MTVVATSRSILPPLKRCHDRVLLARRHAPVHELDPQLRQRFGERGGGFFRGLRVQLIGLLDQRAHPVRLALLPARVANAHDDFVAAVLGQRHRLHRRAARRQLVDDRHVQIGISGHRQRPRDRRRRHDQLMRDSGRRAGPFRAAAGADARRSDAARRRSPDRAAGTRRLPETARACRSRSSLRRMRGRRARACAPRALRLPVSSANGRSSGASQCRKIARVLLGQQLRRRHHRGLKASFHGARGRERGDDRLAAADVALHQPQHRTGLREVALDLLPRAQLRARQLERQRAAETRDQGLRVAGGERPSPDRAESRGAAAAGSAGARAALRTRGGAAPDADRSRAAPESASGGGRCT